MDGPLREEGICPAQDKGSLDNILRLNGMTDINQPDLRVNTQYYPLHLGYIGIGQT
jgi:hypothetical protein